MNTEIEFLKSWDEIEEFYLDLLKYEGWEYVRPIQPFLILLRKQGYDKILRAGQSIHIFTLSRSINHGLKDGQHRIHIEPLSNHTFEIRYHDGIEISKRIQLNNLDQKEVIEFLDELIKQKIN